MASITPRHYCVSEALERLLFEAYMRHASENSPVNSVNPMYAFMSLMTSCTKENLEASIRDEAFMEVIEDFQQFQTSVRDGLLGPTATFWLLFLGHARRVFMLIYAVKRNIFPLYHNCMAEMAELFFCFGGHNYARYLTWYDIFLRNIEISHPGASRLLESGAISVSRLTKPGYLEEVYKTMGETFMKFAKSRGGESLHLF